MALLITQLCYFTLGSVTKTIKCVCKENEGKKTIKKSQILTKPLTITGGQRFQSFLEAKIRCSFGHMTHRWTQHIKDITYGPFVDDSK